MPICRTSIFPSSYHIQPYICTFSNIHIEEFILLYEFFSIAMPLSFCPFFPAVKGSWAFPRADESSDSINPHQKNKASADHSSVVPISL